MCMTLCNAVEKMKSSKTVFLVCAYVIILLAVTTPIVAQATASIQNFEVIKMTAPPVDLPVTILDTSPTLSKSVATTAPKTATTTQSMSSIAIEATTLSMALLEASVAPMSTVSTMLDAKATSSTSETSESKPPATTIAATPTQLMTILAEVTNMPMAAPVVSTAKPEATTTITFETSLVATTDTLALDPSLIATATDQNLMTTSPVMMDIIPTATSVSVVMVDPSTAGSDDGLVDTTGLVDSMTTSALGDVSPTATASVDITSMVEPTTTTTVLLSSVMTVSGSPLTTIVTTIPTTTAGKTTEQPTTTQSEPSTATSDATPTASSGLSTVQIFIIVLAIVIFIILLFVVPVCIFVVLLCKHRKGKFTYIRFYSWTICLVNVDVDVNYVCIHYPLSGEDPVRKKIISKWEDEPGSGAIHLVSVRTLDEEAGNTYVISGAGGAGAGDKETESKENMSRARESSMGGNNTTVTFGVAGAGADKTDGGNDKRGGSEEVGKEPTTADSDKNGPETMPQV